MLPPWTVSVSLSIWVFWLISLGYESKCRASMKFCIVCWLFRLNIRKVCPITNSVVNFDCLYFWVRGVRPEWVVESQLLISILFIPDEDILRELAIWAVCIKVNLWVSFLLSLITKNIVWFNIYRPCTAKNTLLIHCLLTWLGASLIHCLLFFFYTL